VHRIQVEHDPPGWAPLRAGDRCACCSAEAGGRRAPYDLLHPNLFSVPVCSTCRGHAFAGGAAVWIQGLLAAFGAAILLLAYLEHRHPFAATIFATFGAVMLGAAAIWRGVEQRALRRARDHGHHPHMVFEIGPGFTVVDTTNPVFVDTLLGEHKTARIYRADEVPQARAIIRD
jgi:hypothetical protein